MDDQIFSNVVYWFIYNIYDLHFSSTGKAPSEAHWSIKKSMLPCFTFKDPTPKEKLFCEKRKANPLSIPLFHIIGMYYFFHQIFSLVEELLMAKFNARELRVTLISLFPLQNSDEMVLQDKIQVWKIFHSRRLKLQADPQLILGHMAT